MLRHCGADLTAASRAITSHACHYTSYTSPLRRTAHRRSRMRIIRIPMKPTSRPNGCPRDRWYRSCVIWNRKSHANHAHHISHAKPRKTTRRHVDQRRANTASRRPAPRERDITQATPQPRHRTPSQRITHDACDAPAARCRRSGQPQRQQVPLRPQRP